MKYLKTWSGVTSGSYLGRDDGHPKTVKRLFNSIEEMIESHGVKENEKYYELSLIDNEVIEEATQELKGIKFEDLRSQRISELKKNIEKDREEINRLSAY